jgi:hypothetical protein
MRWALARRSRQRGVFPVYRAVLLMFVLLGLLLIPVWLKNKRDRQRALTLAAEHRVANPPIPTPAAMADATQVPRPIAFGLTFALAPADKAQPDVVNVACHGEPAQLDRPHNNACNPYQGDTSCRIVLPVLCIQKASLPLPAGVPNGFYQGWTGGMLAATRPVMGAILESEQMANARCQAELGADWRMAEFHDGAGGWGLQGQRGVGFEGYTRYWVRINDQPGNCWDSQP